MMVTKHTVREFVSRQRIEASDYWLRRFKIVRKKAGYCMSTQLMNQLQNCKDDESRRIILGVSR